MSNIRPLGPEEIATASGNHIPTEVIEAVNGLLLQNFTRVDRTITLTLEEIIAAAQKIFYSRCPGDINPSSPPAQQFHDLGWVKIESSFRRVGWNCDFDKEQNAYHFYIPPK